MLIPKLLFYLVCISGSHTIISTSTKQPLSQVYLDQYAHYVRTNKWVNPELKTMFASFTENDVLNDVIQKNLKVCCSVDRFNLVETALRNALEIEKQNIQENRISFFHGRSSEFIILDTFLKYLKKPAPFVGAPESWASQNETALERINALIANYEKIPQKERKEQHTYMIDTSPYVSKHLLSAVLTPFANSTTDFHFKKTKTISAIHFFTRSANLLPIKSIIVTVLQNYGITNPEKVYADLSAIIKKYKTPEGELLIISIPLDKVDKYAYIAEIGGRPTTYYSEGKARQMPISFWLQEYFNKTKPFFNDELDVQARLVDLDLREAYKDGVKIDILTTLTSEQEKQLENELTVYFQQLLPQHKTTYDNDAIFEKPKEIDLPMFFELFVKELVVVDFMLNK